VNRSRRGVKARAAILVRLKRPLVIGEVEVPELKRGQVLVKMRAAGVCGTQLSEVVGLKGVDPYLPHLLGHEGSGVVEALGAGVTTVKPGDMVIVSWIKGKGLDVPGGLYQWNGRVVNSGGAAVFTERAVVAENRVTRIPEVVPPGVAAVVGCAVATGAGGVRHTLRARRGSSLAVFGVGGVGLSAVMAGRLVGCREIVAVDVSDKKLRLAKTLGATLTVNARRWKSVVATLLKKFPEGVDYALEAAGVPEAAEQAFGVLGPRGVLAIAGHPRVGSTFRVDPFRLIQGRRIVGTWGGETVPERDFSYYIRRYREGALPLDVLIGRRYSLAQINDALRGFERGQIGRSVIEFDDG